MTLTLERTWFSYLLLFYDKKVSLAGGLQVHVEVIVDTDFEHSNGRGGATIEVQVELMDLAI